jgi:FixJ family two-component response regulator
MNESGEVVYLVDDDTGVREAIAHFLYALGMRVVSFGSAVDYIQYKRTDSAACVILDLHLPGISGLELQRKLAEGMSPPIIFISGSGDVPTTVQAMKAGALEFLTKPVDPDALATAVNLGFAQDRLNRAQRADSNELRSRFFLLSPREREVLPLIARGLQNKQAAAILGISEVTLQIHRSHIMKKMAAESFADLVRMAGRLENSATPGQLASTCAPSPDHRPVVATR